MHASASQDKNLRKPSHNEGAHDPDYENVTLAFRNKDQLKLSQSTPTKQAKFKPSLDTAQAPAWLYRTIMMLYVLLAFVFLSCIILSALVLVRNSEMSKDVWTLKEELSNVSNTVWNIWELQRQQKSIWEAVQRDIREVKKNLGTAMSNIQSGNDRLRTVPADITQIKKTLEALEKKAQTPPQPSK
ncbi:mast cell-expressed membrane protein 1 [Apodemus sylvaticus]|uniref:mast cell-expressed membrane protein 1 n=2 Tax=Apodemus sylvaticus TaxID=10129 RepID=UPI002243B3D8|nr:mast cell-expressed membrane protein 1 [Apodemus sylvaticus]